MGPPRGWCLPGHGPVRILDTTKAGSTFVRVPGNGTIDLGRECRQRRPATAGSVDLNVTAVNPASDGAISVYPTGAQPNPIVSNANFKNGPDRRQRGHRQVGDRRQGHPWRTVEPVLWT